MNEKDRQDIIELKIEAKNTSRSVETIIKNHLPHISENTGKIKVLIPLVVMCLGGIFGLYALVIWMISLVKGG